MKIALFCNELPPKPSGGIGTFTLTLASGLKEAGHQICLIEIGEKYYDSTSEHGLRCISIKKSNVRFLGGLITRFNLWVFLQKSWCNGAFDIIEVPDFEGYIPLPSFLPVVVRLHNSSTLIYRKMGRKPPKSVHLFEYLTLRFSRSWVGVSNYILSETEHGYGISKSRVCTIYNPVIKYPVANALPPGDPTILFAGTLSELKGVITLSHALVSVFNRNSSAKVVFVGKSTIYQGQPIEVGIREILHGHIDKVSFTGHVSHWQMLQLMTTATCFAFPSKFESFSLVVAEAMSVGLPVIFTKFPPGPELINDGKTGLLVDPDSPDEIATAINSIIDEPIFARALTSAAREFCIKVFSLSRCVDETINHYKFITTGKKK